MDYQEIVYKKVDAIATIVLSREDTLNALGHTMRDELVSALKRADSDPDVRVVVLTGSGRAFSSGGSMSPRGEARNAHDMYLAYEGVDNEMAAVRNMHRPVIASINGLCYGYALMIVAQCDFIVASDRAKFSLIEARMGSSGATTLPYLIGPQWTKLLAIAGEIIGARTAQQIGLVLKVIPHDALEERTLALARRIAAMPAMGVLLNKRGIDATMDILGWTTNSLLHRSHAVITDTLVPLATTPDGRRLQEIFEQEGFGAFKQARDQAFTEPWFEDGQ